jgi:hypothetical protein
MKAVLFRAAFLFSPPLYILEKWQIGIVRAVWRQASLHKLKTGDNHQKGFYIAFF